MQMLGWVGARLTPRHGHVLVQNSRIKWHVSWNDKNNRVLIRSLIVVPCNCRQHNRRYFLNGVLVHSFLNMSSTCLAATSQCWRDLGCVWSQGSYFTSRCTAPFKITLARTCGQQQVVKCARVSIDTLGIVRLSGWDCCKNKVLVFAILLCRL